MNLLSLHFSINGVARGNVKHIGYEKRIFFQGRGFLVVEKCQICKVRCCLSIYSSLKRWYLWLEYVTSWPWEFQLADHLIIVTAQVLIISILLLLQVSALSPDILCHFYLYFMSEWHISVQFIERSYVQGLFFFQPPIVLLRKYEIRGSQICASRDCAAPPPQPLPLSAPMHQS